MAYSPPAEPRRIQFKNADGDIVFVGSENPLPVRVEVDLLGRLLESLERQAAALETLGERLAEVAKGEIVTVNNAVADAPARKPRARNVPSPV
jgi:hypothetical protein